MPARFSSLTIGAVGLAALLILLAVLQYRWAGQLSTAELTRASNCRELAITNIASRVCVERAAGVVNDTAVPAIASKATLIQTR